MQVQVYMFNIIYKLGKCMYAWLQRRQLRFAAILAKIMRY